VTEEMLGVVAALGFDEVMENEASRFRSALPDVLYRCRGLCSTCVESTRRAAHDSGSRANHMHAGRAKIRRNRCAALEPIRFETLERLPLAAILLTTACASTSASIISEDPTRLDITCRSSLDNCYERAKEECPNGFTVVDRADHSGAIASTYGSSYGSNYHSTTIATPVYNGEMIVECGSSQVGVTSGSSGPVPIVAVTTTPSARAPVDAGGFSFAQSLEASRAACESGGFKWTEGKDSFRCTGTPVDTGLGAHAVLRYCRGELCRIDLVVPPPNGQDDATARRIEKLVSALRKKYGAPTTQDVAYAADCVGPALPGCLAGGSAHFWYEWKWDHGQTIALSLGSRKALESGQTIRIRYGDGRTPDALPGGSPSNAPTTVGELNGL
jgi:hypothetical protein